MKRKLYKILGVKYYKITSSEEHNYLWFRIAKNGTTSISRALRETTTIDIDQKTIAFLPFRYWTKFKFCFIRNPWDRLVSCYSSKVVERRMFQECWDKDFNFFLEYVKNHDLTTCDGHFRLQTKCFPVKYVDYVGKFEHFDEHLNFIVNEKLKLGIGLVRENVSKHDHYSDYYNDASRKLVQTLYKDDIEFGDYSFGK